MLQVTGWGQTVQNMKKNYVKYLVQKKYIFQNKQMKLFNAQHTKNVSKPLSKSPLIHISYKLLFYQVSKHETIFYFLVGVWLHVCFIYWYQCVCMYDVCVTVWTHAYHMEVRKQVSRVSTQVATMKHRNSGVQSN